MNAQRSPASVTAMGVLLLTLLALWGCAGPSVTPSDSPPPAASPNSSLPLEDRAPPAPPFVPDRPAIRELPAVPQPEPTPRMIASLHLTGQAQAFLAAGKPDEAIRVLERAMNLNPSSGESFYYLAEAWLMKGNLPQAGTFHRLAARHLAKDAGWLTRVAEQAQRIGYESRHTNDVKFITPR